VQYLGVTKDHRDKRNRAPTKRNALVEQGKASPRTKTGKKYTLQHPNTTLGSKNKPHDDEKGTSNRKIKKGQNKPFDESVS